MKTKINETLEFNIVLENLAEMALSDKSKEKVLSLHPFLNQNECKIKMFETTDAVKIMNSIGTPPISAMKDIDKILELTQKGSMLSTEELICISDFIYSCRRMKSYLKKSEYLEVGLAFYGHSFNEINILIEEIEKSIRNRKVDDNATNTLRDIRRKIENTNASIKAKLESILRSKKEWFVDGYVAIRNGRFVLPVKKEYKNQVAGSVVDTSGTGSTYFIEPSSVKKLQEELSYLEIDEDNEVRKILYTLTALVYDYTSELKINMDCMEALDFIFAKAKLSISMNAIPVPITADGKIKIIQGRHPLLDQDLCVPLNFEIGGEITGIVITGPNTGGKTVTLKTVGLLSLMAQSGLHVPVSNGSTFSMCNYILCDMGDGQSIAQNLSTFSSHITNVISILEDATDESLVLLDELGSGTDPAEGMGIAIAILEELRKKGCLFVATTHYPQIKDFAMNADGLTNARMKFDRESLKPMYELEIGEAGESCALYIARRLGLPEHMINRAYKEAYERNLSMEMEHPKMIFSKEDEIIKNSVSRKPKIIKETIKKELKNKAYSFNLGDSVMVYPKKEIGIVYKPLNDYGEVVVQIKGTKQIVNHKRIKLITPADQLYPEDYDFRIIFDTVENRKALHKISKKYDPDAEVKYDDFVK